MINGALILVLANQDQSLVQLLPFNDLLIPTHSPSVLFCQTAYNIPDDSNNWKWASLLGEAFNDSVLNSEPLRIVRFNESEPEMSTTEMTARLPFDSIVAAWPSDFAEPAGTNVVVIHEFNGRYEVDRDESVLSR